MAEKMAPVGAGAFLKVRKAITRRMSAPGLCAGGSRRRRHGMVFPGRRRGAPNRPAQVTFGGEIDARR